MSKGYEESVKEAWRDYQKILNEISGSNGATPLHTNDLWMAFCAGFMGGRDYVEGRRNA